MIEAAHQGAKHVAVVTDLSHRDDPIFDYNDEDLEGSRFDPDCENDLM